MRIDLAAAAALQMRLAAKIKGGAEAGVPVFKPESTTHLPPAPASTASLSTPPLAMLMATAAAPLSRPAALRRAEKGLDALERLHKRIRTGDISAEALNELAGWRDEIGEADGAAGALLGEIELRILVELAKNGR